MVSTNLHGMIKTKFLQNFFLPIVQKKPFLTRVSKDKASTSTPKSPTKTSNTKCFKCLCFGHIVTNWPT